MILLAALSAGTKTSSLARSFSLIRETRLLWLFLGVKSSLKCCIRISTMFITELKTLIPKSLKALSVLKN